MKKIACIAHGPGSANALIPVIYQLQKMNYHLDLYAFHPYVAQLWGVDQMPEDRYQEIFTKRYHLILYGTGSGHDIERNVPYYAKQNNIPTLSILDAFWGEKENIAFRFPYSPTYMVVPTEQNKKDVIELHLVKEPNVYDFGNPHFDRLKTYKQEKKELNPPYRVVVFSQPTTTGDYSDTDEQVKNLLIDLVSIKKETNLIQSIDVTLHPRESKVWLSAFSKESDITLKDKKSSFELMLETDINLGVSCTLQYESMMIGKPTIFYQNKGDLLSKLKQANLLYQNKIDIPFDATTKVVKLIEEITKK